MRALPFALWILLVPAVALIAPSCSSGGETTLPDQSPYGGSAGQSGDASAGTSGKGGASSNAGSAGAGGTAGQGGQLAGGNAGSAGQAASAGYSGAAAGSAGSSASAGSAGSSASGGSAGSSAGAAGAAASSGSAGSAGSPADAGPGDPCIADVNCAAGTTCQIAPDSSKTALERRCAPIAGPNGNGSACTDGSQCRSGLCVLGFCSTPCASSNDCTQAGSCKKQDVLIGGLNGSFDLCVVAPCSNTKACDPGEVCSDLQYNSTIVQSFCRGAQAGGSGLGLDCQTSADCASMLCPAWTKICTEVCSGDLDCAAVTGGICVDLAWAGTTSVQACALGCSRVDDCTNGKTCVISSDSKADLNRFVCGPGGTAPSGSDCSTVNNCASGLCLTNYQNGNPVDHICTEPCLTGADCHGGLTVCGDMQMTPPSGTGTQIIRLCNHP